MICLSGSFEYGQAYVALSRMKSLQSFSLTDKFDASCFKTDPKVLKFYEQLNRTVIDLTSEGNLQVSKLSEQNIVSNKKQPDSPHSGHDSSKVLNSPLSFIPRQGSQHSRESRYSSGEQMLTPAFLDATPCPLLPENIKSRFKDQQEVQKTHWILFTNYNY